MNALRGREGLRAVVVLVVLSQPDSGLAQPTTALPPAPDAFTPVAVKYPPVPLPGTEWEKTVRKREAERRSTELRRRPKTTRQDPVKKTPRPRADRGNGAEREYAGH